MTRLTNVHTASQTGTSFIAPRRSLAPRHAPFPPHHLTSPLSPPLPLGLELTHTLLDEHDASHTHDLHTHPMTTPIPINSHTFSHSNPKHSTTPPRTPSHHGGGMTSNSPSSAISISPQTPFFPPPATSQHIGAASPPSANPGFFRWAQAAATLGKSPPPSADHAQPQRGFDIPQIAHDHDDHENHDSFEFGDFDDLKSRSWNKTRRAVSMSAGPGQGASGITAMLSGFGAGAASPPKAAAPLKEGTAVGAMSMPGSGLLADKAARGQGVLRRLSMSGSSFRGVRWVNEHQT